MAVLGVLVCVYLLWVVFRPVDGRLKQRRLGPLVVVGGAGAVTVVWWRFAPDAIGWPYLLGATWGVVATYLMTCALVLSTKAGWLERWFGGLDRMYVWHRRTAGAAVGCLVAPHALITTLVPAIQDGAPTELWPWVGIVLGALALLGLGALVTVSYPRPSTGLGLGYGRWLGLHRFTGLLVLASVGHALLVDEASARSTVLRTLLVVLGLVAAAAYGYTELIMTRRLPRTAAVVTAVRRPSGDVVEVVLRPVGGRVGVTPGQFVYLEVDGVMSRAHPFSVAGIDPGGLLRLVIRVSGADTAALHQRLVPGVSARVVGPFGRFDHTVGGTRQVWVAAGVGVAPFLSFLTGNGPDAAALPGHVDLFYVESSTDTALFADELDTLALAYPMVRVHHLRTREAGRPTLERIDSFLDAGAHPGTVDDLFLCGPSGLVDALVADLRKRGFTRDQLHHEHFAFR